MLNGHLTGSTRASETGVDEEEEGTTNVRSVCPEAVRTESRKHERKEDGPCEKGI